MVGEPADTETGKNYADIAHKADEAYGRRSGLLGGVVGGDDAQKGLRPVEEKACNRQNNQNHHRTGGVLNEVQHHKADSDQRHLNGAKALDLAFEHLVGYDTGKHHSGAAGNLKDADCPAGQLLRNRIHLPLLEECRAPVQHGEAYNVDEKVRNGENPDNRVSEDFLAEELLEGGRIVIVIYLRPGVRELRKTDGFGRVAQCHNDEEDSECGDRGRNPEAELPRRQIAAQKRCAEGADAVRGVPDAHLGGELLRRDPMHHKMVARGETASLENVVDDKQNGHHDDDAIDKVRTIFLTCDPMADDVAEAEDVVAEGTDAQAQHQMPAGIGAIGDNAVYELGDTVNYADKRQNYAETGIGNSVLGPEHRHGKGEVFPDKIKHRVTCHRADDYTPLPMSEGMF